MGIIRCREATLKPRWRRFELTKNRFLFPHVENKTEFTAQLKAFKDSRDKAVEGVLS